MERKYYSAIQGPCQFSSGFFDNSPKNQPKRYGKMTMIQKTKSRHTGSLDCPNGCRQHKKRPAEAGISGFARSGAVQAAPLLFLTGYAHGCRSEYSGPSSRWLPGNWQASSLAVWEWPFPACVVLGSADLLLPFHFAAPNPLQFSWP